MFGGIRIRRRVLLGKAEQVVERKRVDRRGTRMRIGRRGRMETQEIDELVGIYFRAINVDALEGDDCSGRKREFYYIAGLLDAQRQPYLFQDSTKNFVSFHVNKRVSHQITVIQHS